MLDTPGHEAFERIRERGAVGADIAVLVVDAERSVQEQTRSSIEYLNKYGVPAVVALTKMDKPCVHVCMHVAHVLGTSSPSARYESSARLASTWRTRRAGACQSCAYRP